MLALLSVVLAAEPCQRVVLVPLEPMATSAANARKVEEQARAVLAKTPGVCVEPRAETVKRLLTMEDHKPRACRELACSTEQLAVFQADVLVQGLVLGVGGKDTVDLTITRQSGSARSLGDSSELPALLSLSSGGPGTVKSSGPKWPSYVAAGLALGAFGGALGLGASSKDRERALSMGTACAGATGSMFATCLDGQLAAGRGESTAANVLFAVSGALLVAATVLFFVEFP